MSHRFRVFGARAETTPREKDLSEPNSREMTRPVRKLTCHGRQAPTVRVGVQIRSRRRVDRPWTDARAAGGRAAGRALTKKPSSPLSPPSLMVAANAGDAMRTVVAPTTAAYDGSEQRSKGDVSVSRWCEIFLTGRDGAGAPRSSAEASDARRVGDMSSRLNRSRVHSTWLASDGASQERPVVDRRARVKRIRLASR